MQDSDDKMALGTCTRVCNVAGCNQVGVRRFGVSCALDAASAVDHVGLSEKCDTWSHKRCCNGSLSQLKDKMQTSQRGRLGTGKCHMASDVTHSINMWPSPTRAYVSEASLEVLCGFPLLIPNFGNAEMCIWIWGAHQTHRVAAIAQEIAASSVDESSCKVCRAKQIVESPSPGSAIGPHGQEPFTTPMLTVRAH